MQNNEYDTDKVHIEYVSIEEPPRYKVFLLNDDYTTMDFVISILQNIFHKTLDDSQTLMYTIHTKGKGLCGEYTHEIAETKVHLVHQKAQQAGFPLRCIME